MRGPGWPLLRRAPGRMLRDATLTLMITLSVALLAALVAAGPLFARTTEAGSLERKLSTVPVNAQLIRQAALGVIVQGRISPASEARITPMVDAVPWLGSRVTSRWSSAWQYESGKPTPFLAVGKQRREAVLYYRTGAVEALDVVSGTRGAKGIWLPQTMAETLGLQPGDRFRAGKTFRPDKILGCTGFGSHVDPQGQPITSESYVKLAGTYRTAADGRMPSGAYFSAIAAQLPSDPLGCEAPALMMIGDRETIDTALAAAREVPTWSYSGALAPSGRTPERLARSAAGAQALKVAITDPTSELGKLLSTEDVSARVETALPDLRSAAESDARTAADQGRGIALAGGALGIAAVVTALRALAQRRRRETELLLGLGAPMGVVLVAGILELLIPVLVGSSIGGLGAWLAFERFGPQGDLESAPGSTALLAVAFVAALTLVCNVIVTLLQARSLGRSLNGREHPRGSGPWLPLLSGATVLAVGSTVSRQGDRSYTDPLAAVLPILILTCGCLLLVRLAQRVWSVRTRRRALRPAADSPPRSSDRLVLRGLRNTGVAVADLVVILAIGVGVLAYGLVSADTVHASAADKAAVLAGANSTAHIPHSYDLGGGTGPSPHLDPGFSVVWRAPGKLMPDFLDVDVLVVNPETLPSVATWGDGPELERARAALNVLAEPDPAGAGEGVPAILVGDADPGQGGGGTVRVGADDTPLTVKGRIAAFPGATRSTVLFDARSLFPALNRHNSNLNPSVTGIANGQGYYATWLWSTLPTPALSRYLDERLIAPRALTSIEQARATPVLTSSGWAATYQVVLGLAAVALAGLSLLVTVDRRVARAASVDLMLRRFGIPPSRLLRLRAAELALTCLAALTVLIGPFALVLALLPRLVEPGPDLSPALGIQVPSTPLLLSVGAAMVITVLAALVAVRRSSSLNAAEVLRDDG